MSDVDGLLQVGGDGLFQELLNAILAVRAAGGEDRAIAAARVRLGHIPAGSTDAVAYSINGTRSAFTAAAHIALGDRQASHDTLTCLFRAALMLDPVPHLLCQLSTWKLQ